MSVSATENDLAPANNSATQESTVVRQFTLTVATSGTGSDIMTAIRPASDYCPGACSALFNEGTVVALTTTTAGDSTLTNWGGAWFRYGCVQRHYEQRSKCDCDLCSRTGFLTVRPATSPTSVAAGHSHINRHP